jgi:hypothetical protein
VIFILVALVLPLKIHFLSALMFSLHAPLSWCGFTLSLLDLVSPVCFGGVSHLILAIGIGSYTRSSQISFPSRVFLCLPVFCTRAPVRAQMTFSPRRLTFPADFSLWLRWLLFSLPAQSFCSGFITSAQSFLLSLSS